MASPEDRTPEVHPVALLLPWYATGALSAAERQQVDEHLAGCAECRAQLEEIESLGAQVNASFADDTAPDLLRAVQSRIEMTSRSATRRSESPGVLAQLANAMRALFAPSWVPAAAAALIVVQAGTLVWMAQRATSMQTVTPRGLASPVTQVKLAFRPDATEQRLRDVLREVHARFVSGPNADGSYVVEIPTTDAARVEERLTTLRSHSEVVVSAERAGP